MTGDSGNGRVAAGRDRSLSKPSTRHRKQNCNVANLTSTRWIFSSITSRTGSTGGTRRFPLTEDVLFICTQSARRVGDLCVADVVTGEDGF